MSSSWLPAPSPEALPPALATAWVGRVWRHLAECGSTNDEAARWAEAGAPAGAVVTADRQTRGRGRLGRTWHSAPAETVKNLYYSVVLRPTWAIEAAPPLTLAIGVAVSDAVREFEPRAHLKWPNDVLAPDGKKLAGVLCEARVEGGRLQHVIAGIGCNLGAQEFPEELATRAGAIVAPRALFAAALSAAIEARFDALSRGESGVIIEAFRGRSQMWGQRVTLADGVVGTAVTVDRDGALVVEVGDEQRRIVAGEVV